MALDSDRAGGPGRAAGTPLSAYVIAGVLLGVTGVGLLWVGVYSRIHPTLGGIPFFYWYSMLWVIVNAGLQAIAYLLVVRRRPSVAGSAPAPMPGGVAR